jgi:hypothetical protein
MVYKIYEAVTTLQGTKLELVRKGNNCKTTAAYDSFVCVIGKMPTNGTLTLDRDYTSVVYIPQKAFSGQDSFEVRYTLNSGTKEQVILIKVFVTVMPLLPLISIKSKSVDTNASGENNHDEHCLINAESIPDCKSAALYSCNSNSSSDAGGGAGAGNNVQHKADISYITPTLISQQNCG